VGRKRRDEIAFTDHSLLLQSDLPPSLSPQLLPLSTLELPSSTDPTPTLPSSTSKFLELRICRLPMGVITTVSFCPSLLFGRQELTIFCLGLFSGYWLFPCANVPSFSFTFGGTSFVIPAADFNLGQAATGSSLCVGGVVGQDGAASGLGNTFLGEYTYPL